MATPPAGSAADGDGPPDEAWPGDAVEVGRIVDAWGVKGWFKVLPHAAEPQALLSSRRWFLSGDEAPGAAGTGPRRPPPPQRLAIQNVRRHGEFVVAQARDIADRTAAEALCGARVHVSRNSFPSTAPDEFYWVDLIGLDVVNREAQALGRVDGLIDTGAHSVLRVLASSDAAAPATERLIPFVAAYVDRVDLASRTIHVDWGLDF